MMKICHIACLLALQYNLMAADDTVVRTYPLKWTQGSDITNIISELTGESGKVFYYRAGNELIVSTTSNRHQQISSLLSDMDKPVPNVRIVVRMNQVEIRTQSGASVSGAGNVKISRSGNTTHFKFSPEIRDRKTSDFSAEQQMLTIQSGREGYITVGEDIPDTDWIFYYGRSWGYFDSSFTMRRIGASLVARPSVIGSGPFITVTLIPEISGMAGQDREIRRFRFIQAATTVTAQDGETISIGGSGTKNEFYNRFLTGYDKSGNTRNLSITLTPHIVYPAEKR